MNIEVNMLMCLSAKTCTKASDQPLNASEEIDVGALSPVELRVSKSNESRRNLVLANSAQMSSGFNERTVFSGSCFLHPLQYINFRLEHQFV
jgi:hypothetical protein